MLERWTGLTRFLDNPCISLDNNAAERALRGPVVGRKNHYGSKSLRGTQVAALFYTLCESAKLTGVDPPHVPDHRHRGRARDAGRRHAPGRPADRRGVGLVLSASAGRITTGQGEDI
jgi:hypothetical protein